MKKSAFLTFGLFTALAVISARACDLCGCYIPQMETRPSAAGSLLEPNATWPWTHGLNAAVGEQFTHFGTLQYNGREVANPTGQREESFITQFVVGYSFNDRFALQVNLPFIVRDYKRPEGFATDRGTVSGLGDVSVIAKFVLFHTSGLARPGENLTEGKAIVPEKTEPDFTASAVLLGGVKFPTGDSSRIREEFHEVDIAGAPESGTHGHDLTLGTGGYDAIMGAQTSLRYRRVFFAADVQFTLRGNGLHSYHFANDLSWSGGPGCYLIQRDEAILGVQAVLSGENKSTDRFQGQIADDTGITALYLGPKVIAALGRWSGEIGLDLPVLLNNTKFQAVPDYRLRAALSVHF